MVVLSAINLYDNIRRKYNNDWIDRLSHVYSSGALIIFALIFFFESLVDNPIVCLSNAFEDDMWFRYIRSSCYVENKYFITPNQTDFPLDSTRQSVSVDYYPWILVLFIIQAICFVLPHWIWESLNSKTGIPLRSLAIGLTDKIFWMMKPSKYVSSMYIIYKLANLINVLFQLFFLNSFLLTRYYFGGVKIFWDIVVKDIDWSISGHFPRIVFCDFNRRDDPTSSSFGSTAQCLLQFNLLYECMYVALWFWLVIILVINAFSVIGTISFIQSDNRRLKFVERLLYPHKNNTYPHKYGKKDENVEYFVHKVLGGDGVITLRILLANLTQYKVSRFTKALFESCKDLPIKKKEDDAEKVAEP
uniref:Innexin n=1 Tax=Panagrolaimus sp. PS1159 TaxID=55785 RepID=A0AC35FA07_9BILA